MPRALRLQPRCCQRSFGMFSHRSDIVLLSEIRDATVPRMTQLPARLRKFDLKQGSRLGKALTPAPSVCIKTRGSGAES